jgi:predicted nucleotidyltransferase
MVSSVTAREALHRLDSVERAFVEEFRDRVRERFGERLRDLRLYGSKVRGDDHPESDIDVLVLLTDASSDDRAAVWEIAMSISGKLGPHVNDFDRYHSPRSRASGFYKEMREESVRL